MMEEVIKEVEIPIEKYEEEWNNDPMRKPFLRAVIINCCIGESGSRFEKAKIIIKQLTNKEPVEKNAKDSQRGFNVRKGEPIAIVTTLRDEEAKEMLKRTLYAKDFIIKAKSFDDQGNFSFGIDEHIDVENAEFDPSLGTVGFNVQVKLERPGFRIKYRRRKRQKVPKSHQLHKEESMAFLKKEFQVKII